MDLSNLSAENKQLALQLMEMGRTDDAMKLIQAYSGPRVGRGDLGERGELLARGRDIGLDQEDLFVPPQSSFQKFTADLNYGLLQQGNALDQMFSRVTGNDKNAAAADQRVYDMQQRYQESGLADEVTGGRATAAILPSLTGAGVLRNLLMQAPIKTGAAMGATEMMLEPVVDDPNFWTAKAKQAAEGAAWGTGGEVIPRAGIRAV